jgi:tRNA nucleotidyltransferase (CCA-adding enzyme)
LHPITHEEYALARTEKKTGIGYHGFNFYTAPTISIEDDLKRRDFTINAMAQDENNTIIDPFHGQDDLKKHIIRHVSDAFSEDPLRVMRAARFRAKLNFTIASETKQLMLKIANTSELETLSLERIYDELSKALLTEWPILFFQALYDTNALAKVLPEFMPYFASADNFKQFSFILEILVQHKTDLAIRLSILYYYLHKLNVDINSVFNRAMLTKDIKKLTLLIAQNYPYLIKLRQLTPIQIFNLIQQLDPIRQSKRFDQFCVLANFISTKLEPNLLVEKSLTLLKQITQQIKAINYQDIVYNNNENKLELIKQAKLNVITQILSGHT